MLVFSTDICPNLFTQSNYGLELRCFLGFIEKQTSVTLGDRFYFFMQNIPFGTLSVSTDNGLDETAKPHRASSRLLTDTNQHSLRP